MSYWNYPRYVSVAEKKATEIAPMIIENAAASFLPTLPIATMLLVFPEFTSSLTSKTLFIEKENPFKRNAKKPRTMNFRRNSTSMILLTVVAHPMTTRLAQLATFPGLQFRKRYHSLLGKPTEPS